MMRVTPLPHPSRRVVVAGTAAVIVLLVALLVSALRPTGAQLPDVDSPGERTLFGAHVRPNDRTEAGEKLALESLEAVLGRRLDIDHTFYPWDEEFPTWRERWDLRNGRIPMISWNGRGVYASDVAAGRYDPMIGERAANVAALGGTVLLRWFWEMDGNKKSEWAQSPSDYAAAFRHIRLVFENQGARNVRWVWCPNASAFADGRAQEFYPGPEHVDWICADGYNWAPGRSRDSWESFTEIFAGFYDWASDQKKPLMIGEFGVQERGPGEKAAWVRDATQAINTRFPRIRAVVYFDAHVDYDWRIRTSADAADAFRHMASELRRGE